ncbi:hypothetical protein D3C77_392730 [compost metagenome]
MAKIRGFSFLLLNPVHAAFDNRERAQSQEIHLEQPDRFQMLHRILGQGRPFTARLQRHSVCQRIAGNNDASRMSRGVTRHTLHLPGHVEQDLNPLLRLIKPPQLRAFLDRPLDRHTEVSRDQLRDFIHFAERNI